MNFKINNWFGQPIFITKIEDYQKINQEIIDLLKEDIKPTTNQFARTTDVQLKETHKVTDNLHTHPQFKNLFNAIHQQIKFFLDAHHYNMEIFDAYITKAWATFSTRNQHIASHKHTASHFSLVYYVDAQNQGNIIFEQEKSTKGMYIPANDKYYRGWSDINFASIKYPSETGGLIIFPSELLHYTEENTQERPRISISADVLLTMKEGIKSEHCLPSPETWSKIC